MSNVEAKTPAASATATPANACRIFGPFPSSAFFAIGLQSLRRDKCGREDTAFPVDSHWMNRLDRCPTISRPWTDEQHPQAIEKRFSRRHCRDECRIGYGAGRGCSSATGDRLRPDNPLTKGEPEIYRGTAAGAVLAQLRAAGVRTLFHTNTSGFVPFWEAIYAAATCRSST
jgi:hypothetical protein